VVDFVRRHPSRLVLLAAHPTHAETQYGWIEPGDSVSAAGSAPIVTIRRFWEKPSEDVARACWVAGGWWNTLVVVATVAALIDTGTRALPELSHSLAELTSRTGGDPAPSEIRETYGPLPAASFSSGVLEACPARLAASPLPPEVTWSDWGTPERVIASLRGAGLTPPWLRALDRWPESIRRAG
jgi:mannose-1-phosphate guanylyltransferase